MKNRKELIEGCTAEDLRLRKRYDRRVNSTDNDPQSMIRDAVDAAECKGEGRAHKMVATFLEQDVPALRVIELLAIGATSVSADGAPSNMASDSDAAGYVNAVMSLLPHLTELEKAERAAED